MLTCDWSATTLTSIAYYLITSCSLACPVYQQLHSTCSAQTTVDCRLDQSVNTTTTERALLALTAVWHRVPFNTDTWSWKSIVSSLFGSGIVNSSPSNCYELQDNTQQGVHKGGFEGCCFSDIIVKADNSFDWASLPAEAGAQDRLDVDCCPV